MEVRVVLSQLMAAAVTILAFAVPPPRAEAGERRFDVTATKFHFEPESLEVEQGDHVVVSLRSTDVKHGFTLKPYGIKATIPKGGEAVAVEFTADKPGTFSFSCSEYCGPRHSSMKGQLIVRPRAQ
jgi:heme/copper-type cytochrome/quinol oxidase subunit 2